MLRFGFCLFLLQNFAYSQTQSPLKDDAKKEAIPEEAKRLEIEKPTKTTKFETVKSDLYDEEYYIAVDEETAKETGFTKEEIKDSLKKAMDSRTDRREDGSLTIEIKDNKKETPKPEQDLGLEKKGEVSKEPKKKFVAKIIKKEVPKNAHQDTNKPAEKKFPMENGKSINVRSSGACESQNENLLESLKFPNIA